MGKNGNNRITGICLYCFGCNRLEDYEFKGVKNCKNFVAGYNNWYERYIRDIKEEENVRKS